MIYTAEKLVSITILGLIITLGTALTGVFLLFVYQISI